MGQKGDGGRERVLRNDSWPKIEKLRVAWISPSLPHGYEVSRKGV